MTVPSVIGNGRGDSQWLGGVLFGDGQDKLLLYYTKHIFCRSLARCTAAPGNLGWPSKKVDDGRGKECTEAVRMLLCFCLNLAYLSLTMYQ